jgi:hypothetical protein
MAQHSNHEAVGQTIHTAAPQQPITHLSEAISNIGPSDGGTTFILALVILIQTIRKP